MTSLTNDVQSYKTVCMLCFQVCGMNAHVKDGKLVNVEGMEEHPFSRGVLCPRAHRLSQFVYSENRLQYPMKRENGDLLRISWD